MRCRYCDQALSFKDRLLCRRFCCDEHRSLYATELNELALTRLRPETTMARLLAQVEAERHYFQEILDCAPVAIAVISKDLAIHYSNRAFHQYGINRGALWEVDPSLRVIFLTLLEKVFEGKANRVTQVLSTNAGSSDPHRFASAVRLPSRDHSSAALVVVEHLPIEPGPCVSPDGKTMILHAHKSSTNE